jgi:hypothetical protein
MGVFRKIPTLVFIALACAGPAAAEADCLAYEPVSLTITGIVTLAKGYGPPGFGEDPKHDKKEEYALLTLDKPACVAGGHDAIDEDVAAIGAVQLVSKSGSRLDRHLLGKRVAVAGTLFHRVSGGNTAVMILYTSVSKAP